ncbi:MAG: hypothetical protein KBS74_03540 [Clostridiales bacterium]|nr:hypothetical protein [Candidatus Cacconaster stercorequi]
MDNITAFVKNDADQLPTYKTVKANAIFLAVLSGIWLMAIIDEPIGGAFTWIAVFLLLFAVGIIVYVVRLRHIETLSLDQHLQLTLRFSLCNYVYFAVWMCSMCSDRELLSACITTIAAACAVALAEFVLIKIRLRRNTYLRWAQREDTTISLGKTLLVIAAFGVGIFALYKILFQIVPFGIRDCLFILFWAMYCAKKIIDCAMKRSYIKKYHLTPDNPQVFNERAVLKQAKSEETADKCNSGL